AEAVVIASMISSVPAPMSAVTVALPAPAAMPAAAPPVDAPPPAVPELVVASPVAADVPAPAPAAAAAPVAPPSGGRFGGLKITAPAELQVFENGAFLGTTAGPIALAEGSHTFDVVSDALGYRAKQTVTVKGGQMAALAVTLPQGRLNINAAPWAS